MFLGVIGLKIDSLLNYNFEEMVEELLFKNDKTNTRDERLKKILDFYRNKPQHSKDKFILDIIYHVDEYYDYIIQGMNKAETFDDICKYGLYLFRFKNYDIILDALKKTLERNKDAEVYETLSDMYYYGIGVEADEKLGKGYHCEGFVRGQENIKKSLVDVMRDYYYSAGLYHFNTKEYDIALDWFGDAAKLGSYNAVIKTGDMYRDGLGVEKDLKKAKDCYITVITENERNKDIRVIFDYDVSIIACEKLKETLTLEKELHEENVKSGEVFGIFLRQVNKINNNKTK